MKRKVIFSPEAETDTQDAVNWYNQVRSGLGDEFLDCLNEAVARIARNPEAFAVIRRGVRRVSLPRFPYGVFYRLTPESVYVESVMHGRRSPSRWKKRNQ